MPKPNLTNPFDSNAARYDQWFERHQTTYQLELAAIKELLPTHGKGIEIGAGTGRFMGPLGIENGIEPSASMRTIAAKHGLVLQDGVAEDLPLSDNSYDYLLFITALCFVDSASQALYEAYRVLRENGTLIIGMIDKASHLGKEYERNRHNSIFYQHAYFYSVKEIVEIARKTGFSHFQYRQALFPKTGHTESSSAKGHGDGAFVVISARKAPKMA
ncbi:MAG: class I SAM-dependent methyltransferase [Gammaproteobacteria bacterium]|uniref:Class I SAM-dependent methyltransferase n=1 Tax=Candidatus Thiopontia autotrophica TaxID=2841688 RepID=A0A8J6TSD0_9GAMM|nr:class I SAM-dependent methyltransferase [Candidatus Thiopontia autotrophica]